jgi:hypothetical protein
VTDSVNDINLVRDAFRNIALSLNVPFLEVEIVCSDEKEHRYRVENRISDIPGLTPPDWERVKNREYEPGRENISYWTPLRYQRQSVQIKSWK